MTTTNELKHIEYLMLNGNWSDAIQKYLNLKMSAAEFSEHISNIQIENTKLDWILLGFYAKGKI